MVVTVCVVVFTHDLAQGVLAGVLLSGIFFAGKVRRTPTYYSAGLSAWLGVETWVKVESLQLGGSFKVRGCYNKLMRLSDAELN